MAEELSEVFDPLAVLAAMLDMKFYKELLPENYPALSKGRKERQFGSMHGTHRDHSPDSDRRPRRSRNRRSDENAPEANDSANGENARKPERNERKRDKFRSGKEKSFENGKKSDFKKDQHKNAAPAEKPRKRLRDWALDLTESAPERPRHKVKKRK